jgi:hypothetical protein
MRADVGLKAIGAAFYQVFNHLGISAVANFTTLVLSIPIFVFLSILSITTGSVGVLPLGVTLLIGVLPNPAAAGLQQIMRDWARHEFPSLSTQWEGIRSHWVFAAKLWLLSGAVSAILIANLAFYAQRLNTPSAELHVVAAPLVVLCGALLLFWVALHLYVFPLLMEQRVKRVLLTYRNAGMMVLARPFFTGTVMAVWVALLILTSTTGFALLIGLACAAGIQQYAFARLLPLLEGSQKSH